LDGGLKIAKNFVKTQWGQILDGITEPPKDSKTTLQEWAQGKGLSLPIYQVVSKTGPAHEPRFTIAVSLEDMQPVKASGLSKQKAEQSAAQLLLKKLQNESGF
jgi:ribonuclease-3